MIGQIENKEGELIINTLDHFDQIIDLICELTNEQYSDPLDLLSGSSIGQHVRHIVEFYECLFQTEQNRIISYDKRKRNPQLETSKELIVEVFKRIKIQVKSIECDHDLDLITCVSYQKDNKIIVRSSLCRELLYNFEHATHHIAIIKIAVKHYFPSININQNLGVAPSTIKYKNG